MALWAMSPAIQRVSTSTRCWSRVVNVSLFLIGGD
jgi:hypothetical protein